jgi:hypothetical protein
MRTEVYPDSCRKLTKRSRLTSSPIEREKTDSFRSRGERTFCIKALVEETIVTSSPLKREKRQFTLSRMISG